ncbi:EH signature domain-containing protein [Polycladidibacter stylochi]|uniref:EH signature domain-containing protein n=1 Tax=Polycladidibacter stylochi TaxID=1807766 RepID=UPI00082983FF|nr:EH signature domain-containing protein [Pseudovibrio stylochi]
MTNTSLKQICSDTVSSFTHATVQLNLPEITFVGQELKQLPSETWAQQDKTDLPTLNKISYDIIEALSNDRDLTKKQLRKAAWCLWETKPALSSDPVILQKILAILTQGKKRLFKILATVYLSQFRKDRPGLTAVSKALQIGAIQIGQPWQQLQENYALYDRDNGPKRIAQVALQQNYSVPQLMRDLGLSDQSALSGFSQAVTSSILKSLSADTSNEHLRRLELVRQYALDESQSQLFAGQDVEIATALIEPFVKSQQKPDDEVKDSFLDTLIGLFEDPRLNPGRWVKMGPLKEEIISWLTKQSLRQFLDIVDRITNEPSEKAMWQYRRAFWEAVYQKDLIKGAWVIFADDGATATRNHYGKEVQFGRFFKGGSKAARSSHAVLLLRIGNGVVADWSHNGKVNIWSNYDARKAPKLYKNWYNTDEVRYYVGQGNINTPEHFVQIHSSPQTYSWQKAVAERIKAMTNTRIQEREYKVRSY